MNRLADASFSNSNRKQALLRRFARNSTNAPNPRAREVSSRELHAGSAVPMKSAISSDVLILPSIIRLYPPVRLASQSIPVSRMTPILVNEPLGLTLYCRGSEGLVEPV